MKIQRGFSGYAYHKQLQELIFWLNTLLGQFIY